MIESDSSDKESMAVPSLPTASQLKENESSDNNTLCKTSIGYGHTERLISSNLALGGKNDTIER